MNHRLWARRRYRWGVPLADWLDFFFFWCLSKLDTNSGTISKFQSKRLYFLNSWEKTPSFDFSKIGLFQVMTVLQESFDNIPYNKNNSSSNTNILQRQLLYLHIERWTFPRSLGLQVLILSFSVPTYKTTVINWQWYIEIRDPFSTPKISLLLNFELIRPLFEQICGLWSYLDVSLVNLTRSK